MDEIGEPSAGGVSASAALVRLGSSAPATLAEVLGMWRERDFASWRDQPDLYQTLGDRVLRLGEPLVAYDILSEGVKEHPTVLTLRHSLVRALERSGAVARAIEILDEMRTAGHADEQTFGLLGSAYKKLYRQAADLDERGRLLREAAAHYASAWDATTSATPTDTKVWVGINTASTAALLGNTDRARAFAGEVGELCRQALDTSSADDPNRYWYFASLGEAALLAGEVGEAEDWYGRASVDARERLADIGTTRRQARMLLEHFGRDPHRFDRCFPIPRVVAFAGHMIDQPDRMVPRFPSALESAVREAIAREIDALDAGFCFSSAACGSDILFLESARERGAETRVVLPFLADAFRRKSADIIPGAHWGERFDRALSYAADRVFASRQQSAGPAVTFDYSNMLLEGLATIRARQLGAELSLLAVWDGLPGDGPGGTAAVVTRWRDVGHDVRVIDLGGLRRKVLPEAAAAVTEARKKAAIRTVRPLSSRLPRQITAMLFADAKGFSGLDEEAIPHFVKEFLGRIAVLLAQSAYAPVLRDTWGDGLYFVFEDVEKAGRFALDLADLIERTNWVELGLPQQLGLRIGLHAGPTYRCPDPITGRVLFTGSHVSHAARIEPIAPPNHVYASQSFVALASAYGAEGFEWDYVGVRPLSKNYAVEPMYHLRRPSHT